MGVASERAVSIPQITYDHIEDSQEKKDVSFFQEEPRGTVEGKEHCLYVTVLCSVEVDLKYLSKGSATWQPEAYKLYCVVFFHQLRHVIEPRLYMKALGRVLLLHVSTDFILDLFLAEFLFKTRHPRTLCSLKRASWICFEYWCDVDVVMKVLMQFKVSWQSRLCHVEGK